MLSNLKQASSNFTGVQCALQRRPTYSKQQVWVCRRETGCARLQVTSTARLTPAQGQNARHAGSHLDSSSHLQRCIQLGHLCLEPAPLLLCSCSSLCQPGLQQPPLLLRLCQPGFPQQPLLLRL